MATLKIDAKKATKNAVVFNENEAKRLAEEFEKSVQDILDKVSEKISVASEKGEFSVEIVYKEVKDTSKTIECAHEICFIASRKGVNEDIVILRNGGFTAGTTHDNNGHDIIKISWPDPEDDSTK